MTKPAAALGVWCVAAAFLAGCATAPPPPPAGRQLSPPPAAAEPPAGRWSAAAVATAGPRPAASASVPAPPRSAVRQIDAAFAVGCINPLDAAAIVAHLRRRDFEAVIATANAGLRSGTCQQIPRGQRVVLERVLPEQIIASFRVVGGDGAVLWIEATAVATSDEIAASIARRR